MAIIDWDFHLENIERAVSHAPNTARERENARISLSLIRRTLRTVETSAAAEEAYGAIGRAQNPFLKSIGLTECPECGATGRHTCPAKD